ncbi:carboxypeptidase-like regulatory domain-containing protein [Yersinia sp. Marseille-Q5920]|uniref:carboxypeptidase-like regulatory domain-containing protein n=1 Tax=Yersinia sp. Marseille-Q5920 TaxID=2972785 RepID=UPI003A5BB45C
MINPVGEPVINAQITLTAIANSLTVLNTFSATVRTDNIGAYRIQLEEGSYSITVNMSPGCRMLSLWVQGKKLMHCLVIATLPARV